jgi:hypothetical protein
MIRKHVAIHADYHDMQLWRGVETSDIIYDDASGAFTSLLIRKGYLDAKTWNLKTPIYYIEVKGTTVECETPFFLSRGQQLRMQRLKLKDGQAADEVYCIFRVYRPGDEEVETRVLVDPYGMRERGELEVRGGGYWIPES